MTISSELNSAVLAKLGVSQRTLTRRVADLRRDHGPLTGDEARLIIAHESGISLKNYGIPLEEQDRVRALRAAGATSQRTSDSNQGNVTNNTVAAVSSSSAAVKSPTAANRFDAREFHPIVVKRAKKPYVNDLRQDAVLRAFRSVNNRVKSLTGTSRDGSNLMTWAFSEATPILRMSSLSNESDRNEHSGTRFMMQGAMVAMRNPRAHEDHWPRDDDANFALDSLAFASLLHRVLDICEEQI